MKTIKEITREKLDLLVIHHNKGLITEKEYCEQLFSLLYQVLYPEQFE